MRLSLPDDLFPPVFLAEEEAETLIDLADVFVRDAVDQFKHFRVEQRGVVDEKQWRLVKRRCGLAAYGDRTLADVAATARAQAADPASSASPSSAPPPPPPAVPPGPTVGNMSLLSTKLHAVLVVGTLDGELYNLMYGLHHTTTREVRQIKSSYIHDKMVDSKALAAIVEPSAAEPLRGLHIKWALSEYAPLHGARVMRKVVRPRDFVYLESTGLPTTPGSEHLGYSVLHSLQIPGVRELSELQNVRANMSICGVFRQKSPGVVEVFIKGFVDSLGDIPASFAILGTSRALLSYQDAVYCGQMKKLTWLLKHGKTANQNEAAATAKLHSTSRSQTRFACAVCKRELSPAKRRTCQVCAITLCAACVMTRKLSFVGRAPSDKVVQCPIDFCAACVRVAMTADALQIAPQQLECDPREPFELASIGRSHTLESVAMSPSASDVLDSSREFFG